MRNSKSESGLGVELCLHAVSYVSRQKPGAIRKRFTVFFVNILDCPEYGLHSVEIHLIELSLSPFPFSFLFFQGFLFPVEVLVDIVLPDRGPLGVPGRCGFTCFSPDLGLAHQALVKGLELPPCVGVGEEDVGPWIAFYFHIQSAGVDHR